MSGVKLQYMTLLSIALHTLQYFYIKIRANPQCMYINKKDQCKYKFHSSKLCCKTSSKLVSSTLLSRRGQCSESLILSICSRTECLQSGTPPTIHSLDHRPSQTNEQFKTSCQSLGLTETIYVVLLQFRYRGQ